LSLERYLDELSDEDKPLISSSLANLSSLSPDELTLFLKAWSGMDRARQRQIVNKLVGLAEENLTLNFDDIFRACLGDPDEEVRVKAIEGLWECEDRSLIDPLITLLRDDRKEAVRAAAAMALGKFALLAELEKLRPEDGAKVEQALLTVIDDREEQLEVRRRAVEAIAPLSLPKVTEIIQEAYQSDDARMRVSALYAMGRSGDPAWLPILIGELSSLDAEMRFEAAGACGQLGEEEAVPYLIRLIHDIDSQVQLSAIAALGNIGGIEAEEALRECLEHPEERIRDAAAEALGEIEFVKEPFSFRLES
jgi:HEAT repeat protein